ncbi:MAG: UDP-N-acetylmuramate--L-alanine ligase [Clostridia bacterium]|nr:UDP-N-acetylmuramate--L-alanine ligase [Clostridia bacterium]
MDLKIKKRAHMIGVGGVSMQAMAKLLLSYGWVVTGSDRVWSERLTELTDLGCKVWVGEQPERIGLPDLVVYTGAVSRGNPELEYSRCLGVPVLERKIFLSEVADNFECVIAVAGTHGKTTVASMCAGLFRHAGLPLCAHIGGDAIGMGNFFRNGDKYFLTEACEYRRGMLTLRPDLGVVLNVEYDHPDTYANLSEVYDAFDEYLERCRMKIVCGDTPYYRLRQAHSDAITYGFDERNRFFAKDLKQLENGCYGFSVCEFGSPLCTINLSVPGRHNVLNALGSFAVGYVNRIPLEKIAEGIENYRGVKRRFEKKYSCHGATVICDYAHHPKEIEATIETARRFNGGSGRLFVVFQPHTYSRTKLLYEEFLRCFDKSDALLLIKEYAARETPEQGLSCRALCEGISHPDKRYFDNLIDAAVYLQKNTAPGDLILVLGAGDIDTLCDLLSDETTV